MNFRKHFDSVQPPLNEEQKRQLTSIFYDVYCDGIQEGRNQIQTKLVEKLLALLETNT